jgi:hypothetical protein
MKPSIGRIVHYRAESGESLAAIITKVEGDAVTLTVFGPDSTAEGVVSLNMAASPATAKDRNWYWPERV